LLLGFQRTPETDGILVTTSPAGRWEQARGTSLPKRRRNGEESRGTALMRTMRAVDEYRHDEPGGMELARRGGERPLINLSYAFEARNRSTV